MHQAVTELMEHSNHVSLGDDPFDVLTVGGDDQRTDPVPGQLGYCLINGGVAPDGVDRRPLACQ